MYVCVMNNNLLKQEQYNSFIGINCVCLNSNVNGLTHVA